MKETEKWRRRNWTHPQTHFRIQTHASRPVKWWCFASINGMLWGSDTDLVSCWQSQLKSHPQKREQLRLYVHMLYMYFYIRSSWKERPITLNRDFLPPTVTHSHFLFFSKGVGSKKEKRCRKENNWRLFLSSQLSSCKMKWHTVIPKVNRWEPCCLGISGLSKKYLLSMEMSTEASLKTHKHTHGNYHCCCAWCIIYFPYIKTGLENNRWNWIKHNFRERLTVSVTAKVDVKVSQDFVWAFFFFDSLRVCECQTYSTCEHTGCSPAF